MKFQFTNPFKHSNVQTFKVVGPLIFSVVALLNPLNLEPTFAQANFYQDKSVRIIVGFTPGGFYDRWAQVTIALYAQIHPGQPHLCCAKHAGCKLGDRRQLCL